MDVKSIPIERGKIEAAISKTILQEAERLYKESGMSIRSVFVDFVDASTFTENVYVLLNVKVEIVI